MTHEPENMSIGESFVDLYVRHQHSLRAFIRSLVFNRDEADEVLQRTSATMWKKFPELRSREAFLSWAFTIARHTVMNFRRESGRCRLRFTDKLTDVMASEGADDTELLNAQLRHLDACIDRLPDERRDVVKRFYAGDATGVEVAADLGMSADAFYKTLQRARAALLDCVTQRLAAEGFDL